MTSPPKPETPLELEPWIDWIVGRGLAVPAVFLLELHRPLARIASQAMIVGSPVLLPFLGIDAFDRLRGVLADDAAYEQLLQEIEERARAVEEAERKG